MLVSVVIPAYNAASTLRDCLDSVVRQTIEDREIIVIDGGSTDGTVEILREFSARIAHWSSEPDQGIYDAANKGLRVARGDWIYFLGADDRLFANSTLEQIAPRLLEAPPAARIVYGRVAMLDKTGAVLKELGNNWPEARRQLVSYMSLPHQGIFHHRDLFRDHGEYDLSYRTGGDYEFLLRELLQREALFAGDVTVAACRTGGQSGRAAADYAKLLLEWRRAQRKHGMRLPTARWLAGYAGAVLQKYLYLVLGEKTGARVFDFIRGLFGKGPYWSKVQ